MSSPAFPRCSAGFSLVELTVWLGVFGILAGGMGYVFLWGRHAEGATTRLETIHAVNMAAGNIADQLVFSTGVIFPGKGDPESRHQLVFRNGDNQLLVIFRDPDNRLHLFNAAAYHAGRSPFDRILASRVSGFSVQRSAFDLIEFQVTARDTRSEKEFAITNSLVLKNQLP